MCIRDRISISKDDLILFGNMPGGKFTFLPQEYRSHIESIHKANANIASLLGEEYCDAPSTLTKLEKNIADNQKFMLSPETLLFIKENIFKFSESTSKYLIEILELKDQSALELQLT